jgi:hypothetical protein
LPSERYCGWVLTFFFRRRCTILDLLGGNVADQLGKLEGIAGAFAVVLHWPILDDFTSFSSATRPSV